MHGAEILLSSSEGQACTVLPDILVLCVSSGYRISVPPDAFSGKWRPLPEVVNRFSEANGDLFASERVMHCPSDSPEGRHPARPVRML